MSSTRIDATTDVVLDVFRLNGLLLTAGDAIASAEGLTSARWQVLGAVALADGPIPVPRIARRMGLARQSVQVSVNRLVDDGLIAPEPNEGHRRSPLFRLTDRGRRAYERLGHAQRRWMHDLASDLPEADLRTASRVLRAIADRLGGTTTATDTTADTASDTAASDPASRRAGAHR